MRLNPDKIPPPLRKYIPLAEKWNIGDDGFRGDAVRSIGDNELLAFLREIPDGDEGLMHDWLAEPESPWDDEHDAYACLRDALDLAFVVMSKKVGDAQTAVRLIRGED